MNNMKLTRISTCHAQKEEGLLCICQAITHSSVIKCLIKGKK